MTSCKNCKERSAMKTRALTDKDLSDLGIPVRVREGAHVLECEQCGAKEVVIESMGHLLAAAAFALAFVPYKLNGEEVRFCRKALGISGKRLAEVLSVQPETVSRWENDKQPVTDALEKILRMRVASELRDRAQGMDDPGLEAILSLELSPVRKDKEVPVLVYAEMPAGGEHCHGSGSEEKEPNRYKKVAIG